MRRPLVPVNSSITSFVLLLLIKLSLNRFSITRSQQSSRFECDYDSQSAAGSSIRATELSSAGTLVLCTRQSPLIYNGSCLCPGR